MEEVGEKLGELEAKGLKLESLQSNEQFVTAVMHASQVALRTHQAGKLDALRNAVLNVAKGQAPDETVQHLFFGFVDSATHGQFRAHVVRVKGDHTGDQDMHTTGLHQHLCDFQMFYVLKGWVRFIYEGQEGELTFRAGDCVLQPAGIVHNEMACSDDLEILEIYSPAVHETRVVADMPVKETA
jgi:mannose-6-phosphate isomerase-like protein (cupin superfamily)